MRQARDRLERERHELGRLAEETRDGLRHDAPLLRPRAPLDQHFEIELLAREPFQGVLADGAELVLVHVAEHALLEVGIAEPAGIVVAQHALDVSRRQDLADDVEYGVVVQRVADLLQLLEQPLQNAAFDGVGRDEIEDQAVLALAVAVDAAHPLLQAVRVPGDVVVEEDVADLEVDALARGLGGDQDLDLAFAELLLGVKARARLVARARLHAAVDAADAEAPGLQPIHEVVQRVLELGEEEQALVRVVEEAFLLEQLLELRELRLGARILDRLGLDGQASQLLDLLAHLIGASRERDRLEHRLQPLALALLHLLQLFRIGKIRRRLAGEILRTLETLFQAPGAVLERTAHGVGARREPALVERHQEADRAGARVLALGCGAGALALHEARHIAVEVELRPVDLEIHRVRNALGEDRLGRPGAVRPPLGKVDHRLLGAAQVEGRPPAVHRFADRLHVGVAVGIEELQEQAEVLGIALVGRRREQQHVVRGVAQQLAQPVAQALVRLVGGRHAVRLVHDDEVPVDLPQPGEDVMRASPDRAK